MRFGRKKVIRLGAPTGPSADGTPLRTLHVSAPSADLRSLPWAVLKDLHVPGETAAAAAVPPVWPPRVVRGHAPSHLMSSPATQDQTLGVQHAAALGREALLDPPQRLDGLRDADLDQPTLRQSTGSRHAANGPRQGVRQNRWRDVLTEGLSRPFGLAEFVGGLGPVRPATRATETFRPCARAGYNPGRVRRTSWYVDASSRGKFQTCVETDTVDGAFIAKEGRGQDVIL